MIILVIFLIIILLWRFPFLRYFVFHLHQVVPRAIIDSYKYIKYKKYNVCPEFGKIRLNSAKTSQVFGCGKTLSLVRTAVHVFKKYDSKQVWCEELGKFVTQRIHIISNVKLFGVPYIPWIGESQFTDIDKYNFGPEDVTVFLLDEVGTIFNSRNFRDNISMEFLKRLLQSRKNKMCLYMTSQRFQFTDKILRESCSTVTTCRKIWRFIEQCDYDAFEAENAVNVTLIKPLKVTVWFATDDDFHSYDSYQLIENLKKNGDDFLSTSEILDTYSLNGGSDLAIIPDRKLKKSGLVKKNVGH